MPALNYHHLRYFWVIASERNLTRAAERLHVSQSALSIQLRKLEDSLGHALFERDNRQLKLTEAGRIALDYANTIFKTGDELLGILQNRPSGRMQVLRVGAVATLSRNFQLERVRPLLGQPGVELILRSGTLKELLAQLQALTLDLVLSNRPVPRDADNNWHSHLLDEQPVSLVGWPGRFPEPFRFPDDLHDAPLLLPSLESDIRSAFDRLLESSATRPRIIAEVDDMAMLRLLARESEGLALVPPVVVLDELRAGSLVEYHRIPGIRESFYAITPSRRFPNPLVQALLHSVETAVEI
jgi:LysR family transcriptional activator of nhaA